MVEIQRRMYGLPQSGILANTQLQQHLSKSGYTQVKHNHGLFRHKIRNLSFTLVFDDFGVKYSNRTDLYHLNHALQIKYTTTSDFTGTVFCGLTLKWNYQLRYVDISMPGYNEKALQRFKLPSPYKRQHSPHAHIDPKYRARVIHKDASYLSETEARSRAEGYFFLANNNESP